MTRPTNVTGGSPFSGATGTIGAPTVQLGLSDIIDVDLTGLADGYTIVWDAGSQTWVVVPAGGGSALRAYDLMTDFGAACDNTTDDTTAWQDAVDQMAADGGGITIVPFMSLVTDDIVMPDVDYADETAMTIAFIGAFPPSSVPSVVGTTPLNIGPGIRSTATSGTIFTGTSAGGLDNFTNVKLVLHDLIVRAPANPGIIAIDALKIANVDFARLQVDAGSLSIGSISSQSTSTSFGIRLPRVNNGATVMVRDVNIIGYYNGVQVSEHADIDGVFVWGSRKPWWFEGSYHSVRIGRAGWYHCKQGIEVAAGPYNNESYVTWEEINIERAASGTWTQTGDDVIDASDYLYGNGQWHAVLAGTGVVSSFANGAANFYTLELGDDPFGTGFSGDAVDVSISDAGSYYTSTDVEGALQEIGADLAALSPSTGHYEVIVSGTAPPVAVTNVDEDDWLYGFVPD